MTAEVVEYYSIAREEEDLGVVLWTYGKVTLLPLEEAREVAAALHRYDLAKMHDQLEEQS